MSSFQERVQSSTEQTDPFWVNYPSILIENSRLIEFIPLTDMSTFEKLNACMRFLLYVSLTLTILYWNISYMYISLIGGLLLFMIGSQQPTSKEQMMEQLNTEDQEAIKNGEYGMTGVGVPCVSPQKNNPFMNVLLTDYVDRPNRPPACSTEEKDIKQKVESDFGYNLYRDVDDVWDRNNSQRQYYTTPSTTIPNDRDSFMNWLYKPRYVCKDGDLNACLRWQDRYVHGKIQ